MKPTPASTEPPTTPALSAVSFTEAIEAYFHAKGVKKLALTGDCASGHEGTDDTTFCTVFDGYVGERYSYTLGPTSTYVVLMSRSIRPEGMSWKVLDSHEQMNRIGGPSPWFEKLTVYTGDTPAPSAKSPELAIAAWAKKHPRPYVGACTQEVGVVCSRYLGGPDGSGNYTLVMPTSIDGSALLVEDLHVMRSGDGYAVSSAKPLGDYPLGADDDH